MDIDNDEPIMLGYNSNLKCSCALKNKSLLPNNLNMLLTSQSDKNYHDTEDVYENYLDSKPNFKYYEIHDFHKMIDTVNIEKHISLLHTNICSHQANIEKLEILLHDLDF